MTACFALAGHVGVSVLSFTLRELWLIHSWRLRSVRQQILWQTELIARMFSQQKGGFDAEAFINRGSFAAGSGGKVRMSPALRAAVEVEQGRLSRELAERQRGIA